MEQDQVFSLKKSAVKTPQRLHFEYDAFDEGCFFIF